MEYVDGRWRQRGVDVAASASEVPSTRLQLQLQLQLQQQFYPHRLPKQTQFRPLLRQHTQLQLQQQLQSQILPRQRAFNFNFTVNLKAFEGLVFVFGGGIFELVGEQTDWRPLGTRILRQ